MGIDLAVDTLDDVTELALSGLQNDGGDHKQWYLEQILETIVGKDQYDYYAEEYYWEEGMAP